ncbi:MAG: addiction module toxin RelE [Candidatus Aenigmarchaeota archaeon]|nr:addiction module toxin RelE [Candidatus Aenigmarchaeota archaeon]
MNVDTSGIENILRKHSKKDFALFKSLVRKINQIGCMDTNSIEHFKNLRHDLSHLKRIQVGSFVLVFRVKEDIVIFEDFDHHDRIYKKRFC